MSSVSTVLKLEETAKPVPAQLCNIDRLLATMEARNIDGVVALLATNQFYMSSMKPHHSIPETEGSSVVVFSRHLPDHPILLVSANDITRLLYQPTWIRDVRPYAAPVFHPDRPSRFDDLGRFASQSQLDTASWGRRGKRCLHENGAAAVRSAIADLGLSGGRVAFDNLSKGMELTAGFPTLTSLPGEGIFRHARAGKTSIEIEYLRRAAQVNQEALQRAVKEWAPGMTWHDLTLIYQVHAMKLGGEPNLPDTMALSNAPGNTLYADFGLVDHELTRGMHVMFDCHGKYNGYCWDGGKSWVVAADPDSGTRKNWQATFAAAREIEYASRPGVRIGELIDKGHETYRKHGVDGDGVLIYFHGLGLDHLDQERVMGDRNWKLEDDMVISTHIHVPGNAEERLFLEEIVFVGKGGSERLFTWNDELLTN